MRRAFVVRFGYASSEGRMDRKRSPIGDWTGRTFAGKWTVEGLIGAGGTATVLRARHRNGNRAALKVLHPHLAAHGRSRERFLREGRLANLVDHPGIITVLDDFMTDDGMAVLVLELVQGKTLATLAKESGGVLPASEVVDAAGQVLEILAAAHDVNVIHRDVKPENVLRLRDGRCKLADFGMAALSHELGALTGMNSVLGTPGFISPEQARGAALDIDARTDIWSVGAMMFTLLTGRFLHATAANNLVFAAATEPVPPVLSLEPGMHPQLAEIIDRAVQMDRGRRWPNSRVMLTALQLIDVPIFDRSAPPSIAQGKAEGMATKSSVSTWSHASASGSDFQRRRRWPLVAASFAAGAVGIAVASVWLTTRPPSAGVEVANASKAQNVAQGSVTPVAQTPALATAVLSASRSTAARAGAPSEAASRVPPATIRASKPDVRGGLEAELLGSAGPLPSAVPPTPSGVAAVDQPIPPELLDRRR